MNVAANNCHAFKSIHLQLIICAYLYLL